MIKTSITSLIRIYHACKTEKRDNDTTLGQLCGEIFHNTKNPQLSDKIGKFVFKIILENEPASKSHNRNIIDDILLNEYPDYLYTSHSYTYRLNKQIVNKMKKYITEKSPLYKSEAHFIENAIIKLIDE